jgi:hypothetical protein
MPASNEGVPAGIKSRSPITTTRTASLDHVLFLGVAIACTTLTVLMLAHNLFGNSFFEARCSLDSKTTGHFL